MMYIASNLEAVTEFLGKDPMLTGRVPLWVLSAVMALRRPWFGYGFDAFWLPDEPYVQKIWQLLRWQPPHAHNGILELWLELGVVGVGLYLLVFAYYVIKAVRFMHGNSDPVGAWPLMFLTFLFLANLTESAFLGANSIYFVLYVSVAATLAYSARIDAGIPSKVVAYQARYA
jgi:O-antigen ligase